MTKFIKLTETMSHGDNRSLVLNITNIAHVQQGLNGRDTHIKMSDFKTYYFVKESVEEINLLLMPAIVIG